MKQKPKYPVVAVDFDGTLCINDYPLCGKPRWRVIRYIRKLHKRGSKIILYTCRQDASWHMANAGVKMDLLSAATRWCQEHGVPIDAVNENPWTLFRCDKVQGSLKVYADLYIDDHARRM